MEFSFVRTATEEAYSRTSEVPKISDYLDIELSQRDYGQGIAKVIMGIACTAWNDGATGRVGQKKYTRSKRLLELVFGLSHREVMSSDSEQLVRILKQGVLATYSEVKAMGIKDFDVDAFYRDVGALIDERGWIKNPEKYKKPPFEYKGPLPGRSRKVIPPELMMPEADFWGLIRQSIEVGEGKVERQLAYLEDNLATRSEKDITGFELALRDLIRRSYHHNVVALLKVIEGMVTDDPLLYFRCRLILYGREVFYAALENPNNLTQRLDNDPVAELLLTVADKAFVRRFGENTDKNLPGDVGSSYLDYNTDSYPFLGTAWTDRSFAKRYAALLKLYK